MEVISELGMDSSDEPSLEVLRHLLASLDLSDHEEVEMTENERKTYCTQIHNVFPILKKDIKKLMYEQIVFGNNNTANWDQVMFSRGTFNGFALLMELWEKASQEHEDNIKPKEEPTDKHSSIAEV